MNRRIRAVILAAILILAGAAAVVVWLFYRPPSTLADLEPYRTGLSWPVAFAFAPDGRIFYAERLSGAIRIIADGDVLPDPFFTIPDVATSGEQGLLGLALDPDFPTSPYVYAYQTFTNRTTQEVYNRIVRVRADGDAGSSLEVVLDRIPAATVHDGGVIAFGPDGKLYAVVGDATNSGAAQDVGSVSGKVLRMNPDGTAPSNNPLVDDPAANALVFTYGHRNMFGIAFHPETGSAYLTENGPTDSDELNRLVPGGNYGWPAVRGIANTPPYIDPLLVYTPVIVPTNAAFYTGSVFPGWAGHLIFGDYRGRLHGVTLAPDGSAVERDDILAETASGIVDVEMGPDGTIWFTTESGMYRVVPMPVGGYSASFWSTLGRIPVAATIRSSVVADAGRSGSAPRI